MITERTRGARRPSPGAVELGVTDPLRFREVFYGTVENAIVPGLEQFGIEAGRAYAERASHAPP